MLKPTAKMATGTGTLSAYQVSFYGGTLISHTPMFKIQNGNLTICCSCCIKIFWTSVIGKLVHEFIRRHLIKKKSIFVHASYLSRSTSLMVKIFSLLTTEFATGRANDQTFWMPITLTLQKKSSINVTQFYLLRPGASNSNANVFFVHLYSFRNEALSIISFERGLFSFNR